MTGARRRWGTIRSTPGRRFGQGRRAYYAEGDGAGASDKPADHHGGKKKPAERNGARWRRPPAGPSIVEPSLALFETLHKPVNLLGHEPRVRDERQVAAAHQHLAAAVRQARGQLL